MLTLGFPVGVKAGCVADTVAEVCGPSGFSSSCSICSCLTCALFLGWRSFCTAEKGLKFEHHVILSWTVVYGLSGSS